jgi:hypothetical protein
MQGVVWCKHHNVNRCTFFLALLHKRQHVNTIKKRWIGDAELTLLWWFSLFMAVKGPISEINTNKLQPS